MKIKISIICIVFLGLASLNAQEKKWTLRECVEYAIKNNITVKQSALNVEAAQIDKKDAIGGLLPSFNLTAQNSWSSGLAFDPISGGNRSATFRSSNYAANIGVTLFDGLRNLRQLQRAKLNMILSQYNLGKSKDDIALFVANSYLQVLVNKESLKVIEKQHEITLAQLDRTKDLVEAGVLPENDLLDIEATSANELTRIVQAENAVLIARVALAQTLLIKDYQNFDIEEREYMVPAADMLNKSVQEIRASAREARYEVQIAEQNKLLSEKDLQLAKGAYYPTLSAFFNYNTRESDASGSRTLIDPDNPLTQIGVVDGTGQSVLGTNFIREEVVPDSFTKQLYSNDGIAYGVQLSIPIFNGFAARNAVKRSKINMKRAAFQLEQAELDLDSNVYQAYVDAKGSAEAYEASQVAVKAQERAYQYAKDRYDVGMMNAFDFSQSKFRLENAQSTAVQAKFDYIFKLKVLELYFGIKVADIKL